MCSKSAESEMFDSGAQLPLSLIQRLEQEHPMLPSRGSILSTLDTKSGLPHSQVKSNGLHHHTFAHMTFW